MKKPVCPWYSVVFVSAKNSGFSGFSRFYSEKKGEKWLFFNGFCQVLPSKTQGVS